MNDYHRYHNVETGTDEGVLNSELWGRLKQPIAASLLFQSFSRGHWWGWVKRKKDGYTIGFIIRLSFRGWQSMTIHATGYSNDIDFSFTQNTSFNMPDFETLEEAQVTLDYINVMVDRTLAELVSRIEYADRS